MKEVKEGFRPIAMRCTQEQFDAIEPNLKEIGKIGNMLGAFKTYEYLTNYYLDEKLLFDFTREILFSVKEVIEVFEEWNEKTFLEYCGIEVKDEVNELEKLRKENAELKQQLKSIEDQPKVGDVCLFWDNHTGMYVISKLNENGGIDGVGKYDNYIKATDENIKAKINELKND